jgi:hypothetical protein
VTIDHDLGPVTGKLAALLAAERRAPAAPAADRARVWSAIVAKLPPPGGDGGGGDGGGGVATAATTKTALPWIAGAAGAGAAVIAIVVATRPPRAPSPAPAPAVVVVTSDAAVEPVVVPVPDPPPPDLPPAVALPSQPGPRSAPPPPPPPPPPDDDPAPAAEPEDVLIERARISLVRAHFDEAQRLLAEHEQRFPRGPMRGERELLYVRALLGASKRSAAEARAAALRAADPDNPSLPAIDAALAK